MVAVWYVIAPQKLKKVPANDRFLMAPNDRMTLTTARVTSAFGGIDGRHKNESEFCKRESTNTFARGGLPSHPIEASRSLS